MQQQYRPTRAEINLDALRANYEAFRHNLPDATKLLLCVKANAYGHGAVEVSRELERLGADYLSVAFLDEAIELRQHGVRLPILVLGYTGPEAVEVAYEYDVTLNVFTEEVLEAISQLPIDASGRKLKAHIKIDSGMGRLGLFPENAPDFIVKAFQVPVLEIEGMFTHFAKADEHDKSYTLMQYERFQQVDRELRRLGYTIPIIHTGNSAAAIDTPELSPQMIRVGIALYGLYPSTEVNKQVIDLTPVMTVKTAVSYLKTLPAGSGVSYGTRYFTGNEEKIATLPVGYADGYSRMLSGKAQVLIRGHRVPVIGTICMDQCMVSLKSFAESAEEIQIGEEVVLIGRQQEQTITADDLASALGTINYEIICMLASRVPRVYYRNGNILSRWNPLLNT
ncbi:alanine racemase [Paenibacillus bovis]|uniref:Alanine racemase n=1 Tax=Paenibacillus bovis TaxID=1616788 RepID=A0A172ZEG1_9BACL|nr:alanine racemase [Paenibacillus bovis]ANF96026.1 alanine racemase [Paenibacillus bovis]